jgi:hypothetical protein
MTDRPGPVLPLTVVFCGSCGWTLEVMPAHVLMPGGFGAGRPAIEEVAEPANAQSPEGQFQIRCRELITETRALGFDPNVWVSMVHRLGALVAAKKPLADHHVLVATPWLVARGQEGLTLEAEIALAKWSDLYTNDERAEAKSRLAGLTSPS